MKQSIENHLRIPSKCTREVSKTRFVCLVTETWLKATCNQRPPPAESVACQVLTEAECDVLLAQANQKVSRPLQRVTIKVIQKEDRNVESLVDVPLCGEWSQRSYTEIMATIHRENFCRLWGHGNSKYPQANIPNGPQKSQCKHKNQIDLIRELLLRRFQCPLIPVGACSRHSLHNHTLTQPSVASDSRGSGNLVDAYSMLESETAFYIVQPYWQYTLQDCVTFSPAKLAGSFAKPLFVLYQVLQGLRCSHEAGVAMGDLRLQDVLLDDNLWVRLSYPPVTELYVDCGQAAGVRLQEVQQEQAGPTLQHQFVPSHSAEVRSPSDLSGNQDTQIVKDYLHYTLKDLPSLVEQWLHGKLSNLDYLMALNHLAGRRMGDPNHHPVLPWVSDFSSASGKYRDLTKSKFRLNKGDTQLELTYDSIASMVEGAENIDHLQIPHHITDFLSDITYYVYKARQIPKSVLCANVRTKWVPNEYPSSMQRMQEWTPDECIPEFFTDPSIFTSMHEDLPNLEVPPWASSPEDFVKRHLELLEGDHVSQRLHHWIDLTFGCKLSGNSAIKAKNVCLQLVDQHMELINHGVVQLFNQPHPPRQVRSVVATRAPPQFIRPPTQMKNAEVTSDKDSSKEKANSLDRKSRRESGSSHQDESPILLPKGYDPLALLDQVEALYNFASKAAHSLPPGELQQPSAGPDFAKLLVAKDMQAFGCLAVELFLSPRLRVLSPEAPMTERYRIIRKVCTKNMEEIPRPVRRVVGELLQVHQPWQEPETNDPIQPLFAYPVMNCQGLPPPNASLLLHPFTSSLPFPSYFPPLYSLLARLKQLQNQVTHLAFSETPITDRMVQLRQLNKDQVVLLSRFLHRNIHVLDAPGLEIVLPYVTALMEQPWTAVQAVWAMFNPMATALGPGRSASVFLPPITALMDGEWSSPKHLKLYHRSFILQLLIRLGAKCFLANFATLLIEACAGYKDYQGNDDDFSRPVNSENIFFGNVEQPDMDYPQVFAMDDDDDDDDDEMESDILDIPSSVTFEVSSDQMSMDGEDLAAGEPGKGSSDSGSMSHISEEQADSQSINSSDLAHSGEQTGPDDTSLDSTEVSEELLGQSLGRLSVHSITRLMQEEKNQEESDEEAAVRERNPSVNSQHKDDPEDGVMEAAAERETGSTSSAVGSDSLQYTRNSLDVQMEYNIRDAASETIKWLAHRLGPVLTAKYLSRNLLRMLALCYLGDELLITVAKDECCRGLSGESLSTTHHQVVGDGNASQVLECLSCIAILYGEHVILLQYFSHMKEQIRTASNRLSQRSEAGILGAVVLLTHILPYLSDKTLMDNLQEILFKDFLLPLLNLVSSLRVSFPGGSTARRVLCYKVIDALYMISLRIGFENTRQHMTFMLQKFFSSFNRVYDENFLKDPKEDRKPEPQPEEEEKASSPGADSLYFELKLDNETKEFRISSQAKPEPHRHQRQSSGTFKYTLSQPSQEDKVAVEEEAPEDRSQEKIFQEMLETFTPELAHTAYIPFCRLAGGIHMEQNLINDDLIRQLCSIHDEALSRQQPVHGRIDRHTSDPVSTSATCASDEEDSDIVSGSFGRAVSVAGNRIVLHSDSSVPSYMDQEPTAGMRPRSTDQVIDYNKLRSPEMEINRQRHLKGNWLAYWEHEIGLSERDSAFNFKQIKLLTFTGHSNSVRSIYVLANENSFLSASKDKTVRLWSLRSTGDGTGRAGCQWSYHQHKKSVFAVTFLEAPRMAASCDGNVHIWDPFVGLSVRQHESPRNNPVTVLSPLPAPQAVLLTATSEATLRFLDVRAANYTHEFKCSTGPAGLIRCTCVSPDGHWVAVGYSSGVMSLLDVRTGVLFASWKCHEGEILQVSPYGNKSVVTSSLDGTMAVWNVEDAKLISQLKGATDPVHCFSFYGNEIISASTGNRIGVHTSVDRQATYSSTKLRSDVFRGMLTTMSLLPENKLLLLGADNGNIKLLA